jgi:predicted dehydrogenase
MTYRVALIGAGNMGRAHASQWPQVSDANMVAVLDCSMAKSKEVADAYGASAYEFDEFDAMVRETKPDIIDICTPTPAHRPYVERAAAAGIAVFCEKPLARTLADCDAAVAAVERTGIPFMAGHVLRFFPEYASAKRLIDSGAIGKPAAVRMARMAGMPDPHKSIDESWYKDPGQSGGVLLDMIIHDFDWLRYTFGPVSRVFAKGVYTDPRYAGTLDYSLVTLRFESGVVAHVTGSWAHPGGFRTSFEVVGDAGMIEHDNARSAALTVAIRGTGMNTGVVVPESPQIPEENPYFMELQAFVDALKEGRTPPVTVYDAYEATRIAIAALTSIEAGKVIKFQ